MKYYANLYINEKQWYQIQIPEPMPQIQVPIHPSMKTSFVSDESISDLPSISKFVFERYDIEIRSARKTLIRYKLRELSLSF